MSLSIPEAHVMEKEEQHSQFPKAGRIAVHLADFRRIPNAISIYLSYGHLIQHYKPSSEHKLHMAKAHSVTDSKYNSSNYVEKSEGRGGGGHTALQVKGLELW